MLDGTLFGVDEFPIDDQQREAAVAHLASEHARGAFDAAELQRRTDAVRVSHTVSQLLAATAEPTSTGGSMPSAAAQQNRMALIAGVVVAVILGLVVLSQVF
jgi:hypothetical protein